MLVAEMEFLAQLEKAQIDMTKIHHLFITHAHTDHVLGDNLGSA